MDSVRMTTGVPLEDPKDQVKERSSWGKSGVIRVDTDLMAHNQQTIVCTDTYLGMCELCICLSACLSS